MAWFISYNDNENCYVLTFPNVCEGVKLLVSLVALNPAYAVEYQDMIVQSLEHKDTVIQKKVKGCA